MSGNKQEIDPRANHAKVVRPASASVPPGSSAPQVAERSWYIGHQPRNDEEWLLEHDLMARDWWDERAKRANFAIGYAPTTPEERDLEFRLRSVDRKWEVQLKNLLARGEQEHAATEIAAQAERIRGFVVIGIVAALIIAPIVAMFVGIAPADFGQFVAPVSGIAGTVIGYWFGRNGQASQAPSAAMPAGAPDEGQELALASPPIPTPSLTGLPST